MGGRIYWCMLFGILSIACSCVLNHHDQSESIGHKSSSTNIIQLNSGVLELSEDHFTSISFKRIPPNQIEFKEDSIVFQVRESASFLLYPFGSVKKINQLRFDWKSKGEFNVLSAKHEATKKGDDARIRLGLILKSKADFIDLFGTPEWIRKSAEVLNHPADRIVFLLPGAFHEPGTSWKNPYSPKVDMISIPSKDLSDGWKQSEFLFEIPLETVGFMIMADGDNTHSSFSSEIKNLHID